MRIGIHIVCLRLVVVLSLLTLIYTVPLGPFDGKVAAPIEQFVCTTPNQDRILLPPMQRRELFLRSNFRYGPDDPTLWPQPFLFEYPHLGAIPRQPENSNDPLSVMWWNPTRSDFIPLEGGILDGMGQLATSKYWGFQDMSKELKERVEKYKKNSAPNSLLSSLVRAMDDALVRLGSLKSPFGLMWFKITEFQRLYLEIYALLDYMEIYKPRMDGHQLAATTVANCVGVFTNVPQVAQFFHRAGLPVWLLQPRETGPFPHNVLAVVSPLDPFDSLCISPHDPPFPVIFRGYMNTREKHDAIHSYSRKWLVFKDPFHGEPPSKDQEPERHAAPGASCESSHVYRSTFFLLTCFQASKPKTAQVAGRNKYLPLIGPLSPFSIPAWSAGLQAVDQSPSRLVEVSKSSKHFGHYAFPDPGLFVSPASDTKKAKFIESWLRIREGWLMRLATETSLAMSAQNWRDLLAIDLSAIHEKNDTKAAKRRKQILALLTPKSEHFPEIKTRSTSGEPVIWQGNKYPPGCLPADHIVRGVLWELYCLNFAYEFLSLDRRTCSNLDNSDDLQLMERQVMISGCFTVDPFLSISLPDRNCGLFADDIEERLPFILRFVRVMQSWKGDKPPIFDLAAQSYQEIPRSQAIEFEEAATKYYCQQFFNYFGRAALVPHGLYMPIISLAGFM